LDHFDEQTRAFLFKNLENVTRDVQELCRARAKTEAQLDILLNLFEKYTNRLEGFYDHCHKQCLSTQAQFSELKDFVLSIKKDINIEHDFDVKSFNDKIQKAGDSTLNFERVVAQRFAEIDAKIKGLKMVSKEKPSGGVLKNFGSSLLEKAVPVGVLYALLRFLENSIKAVFDFASNQVGGIQ